MTQDRLHTLLTKSSIQVLILTVISLAIGSLTFLSVFIFDLTKGWNAFLIILGLIFVLPPLLGLKNSFPAFHQAKSKEHPMMDAIKRGKKDYLVWVYIKTTAGESGSTFANSNTLVYYTDNCKGMRKELILTSKDSPEETINYLTTVFDIPYVGYNEKIVLDVTNYFGAII